MKSATSEAKRAFDKVAISVGVGIAIISFL